MTFSKRLKEARTSKGLTQQQLADIVKTKKNTISNYETGYSTPPHHMIVELADTLGVTTDYLLGRVDAPDGFKSDVAEPPETLVLLRELKKLNRSDLSLLTLMVKRLQKNGGT